jgi:hypothetical protein
MKAFACVGVTADADTSKMAAFWIPTAVGF